MTTPDQPTDAQPVARDDGLAVFTDYFVKNYPGPNTIISNPHWHAPKIFRAAQYAINSAAPAKAQGDDALAKLITKLRTNCTELTCSANAHQRLDAAAELTRLQDALAESDLALKQQTMRADTFKNKARDAIARADAAEKVVQEARWMRDHWHNESVGAFDEAIRAHDAANGTTP